MKARAILVAVFCVLGFAMAFGQGTDRDAYRH